MGLVNYWYLRHCLIRIESQNLFLSLILHAHFFIYALLLAAEFGGPSGAVCWIAYVFMY